MRQIYVCSPSAPFLLEEKKSLSVAEFNLKNLGFKLLYAPHAFSSYGNTSANITDRVTDLMLGSNDESVTIIMATRGGFNSNELLPELDFIKLKYQKKIFVGMSDMTTLCVNLWQKSNWQTYYGLMLDDFFIKTSDTNFRQFQSVLCNPLSFSGFYRHDIKTEQIFRHGHMEGIVCGGNLAVLCWLLGTKYALDIPPGAILFLEDDTETNGYYWQMYLSHLKQVGVFNIISGLVIGKVLPETKFNNGSSFIEILSNVIGKYNFPVLIDADFGHIENPITIPYGVSYYLTV